MGILSAEATAVRISLSLFPSPLSLSFSLVEAIGILITRSVKIARNLGRVITPKDAPPY